MTNPVRPVERRSVAGLSPSASCPWPPAPPRSGYRRYPSAAVSSWHLAPALVILDAGMGMVVVPLLPFILCSVDPDDAGSASGVASAAQQIGGALGVALIGTVFFRQLGTTASYVHAFITGIWLQLALLAIAAAATFFLPARITADAYKPHP